MIETCIKCGTSYKIDENKIVQSVKLFKCSVCNFEWSINDKFSFDNQNNLNNKNNVKKELEAIRTEIQKNTNKIEEYKTDNQVIKSKNKKANKVLNVKNKSVTEIASEIAASYEKRFF